MADTTYIVLRERGVEMGGWEIEHGGVAASSSADAIRKALNDGRPVTAGTYVAVPARSWKPVQVEAVQTTVLKLT